MSITEKNSGLLGSAYPTSWQQDWLQAFFALVGGFFIIGLPVVTHLVSPLVAIPMAMVLSGLVANFAPRVSVVAIIVALLFQNFFVSLISGGLSGPGEFKIVRGYNFIVLTITWCVIFAGYLTRFRGQNPSLDKLMNLTILAIGIIVLYFAVGVIQNPTPATIYLRNIMSPIMVLHITMIVIWRNEFNFAPFLLLISFVFIVFGYTELIFRQDWLDITGGNYYWALEMREERLSLAWDKDAKETGRVVTGLLDSMKMDFLNTPLLADWNLKTIRLQGPNMHAISYSYAVAFFVLFAFSQRATVTGLLLLPLLLFANAKGSIILFILVCSAWIAFRFIGARLSFYLMCLLLSLYAVLGIIVGLNIGDFHVLGFMGGLFDFMTFPFGHGIGVGGNLGTDFSTLDWPLYQSIGRTPVALESAVGVLIYQMGPGSFFLIGFYIWLAWQTIRIASFTGIALHIVTGFALLTILVNGIFQEEALFSPLSLGLFVSLNGMVLGQALRRGFVP